MMEISEYLTIVAIVVSMVLSALGLFFGIMLRTKGPYRTGWTDVPIEHQLQDGEFRWPKGKRFMGKLPDCWRWMFVGLFITIAYRDMEGRSSVMVNTKGNCQNIIQLYDRIGTLCRKVYS